MKLDGEKFFEPILTSFGFIKVEEMMNPEHKVKNADFINIKSRTIVEVKTIEKEYMPNGGIICETNTLLAIPKKINLDGTGQYSIELIADRKPQNIIYDPIRRLLRKASKQILSTQEFFFKNDKGLDPIRIVLLVLQGLKIVPIEQVSLLVQECLNRGLTHIDCVCICNPFFYSKNPLTGKNNERCILVTRQDNEDKAEMCCEFTDIINAAIKLHYGEHQDIIKYTVI